MSTPQQQAEELLPDNLFGYDDHKREARQAVAAVLGAKDAEIERLKVRPVMVSPTCVYLSDSNKVIVKRDGKRVWLEVVPQDRIGLESPEQYQPNEIAQLRSQLAAAATDIMKMSKLSLEIFLTRGDFAEDDRPKIKRWLASIDSWIAQAERKGE